MKYLQTISCFVISLVFVCTVSGPVQAKIATDCANVNANRILPELQCLALLDLYTATDGPNWTNNTGWGQDDNPCAWYGIVCSAPVEGSLISLNLDTNNLVGTIPTTLGRVTGLQYLKLSNNQLTDSIPPELGNLGNLTELRLNGNQLTKSIPPELGNLANLTYLLLNSNQLTGSIPSDLQNLTKLVEIWLYGNQLTGPVPSWLGTLSNLEYLWLTNNQFTGPIPSELGNLSNLYGLEVDDNKLTGPIPTSIGNLQNLRFLYFADNNLCGEIPSSLANLTNLQDPTYPGLDIRNNYLFTDDPALDAFLIQKGGDWESSQGEVCPSTFPWNLFLPAIMPGR